jgi:hypothetical protein
MTQNTAPVPVLIAMAILFAFVLVWFYMVSSLFKKLRINHQAKFAEMGKPSLFLNNSPKTSILLFRFLFRREDKALGDPAVTKLTKVMIVFFLCYTVLFLGFFLTVLASVNWHPVDPNNRWKGP